MKNCHLSQTQSSNFVKNIIAMAQSLLNRITINPNVSFGKPTIRNMRYPVEIMLDLLSAGMTIEEILEDYPDLEREDLLACLEFASQMVRVKSIHKVLAA